MRRLFLVALGLVCAPAAGGPLPRDKVPEPLKPWTEWVLHGQEDKLCPALEDDEDQRRCAWPSRLSLGVEPKGGKFMQEWSVQRELWVSLPGEEKHWPQDVRADGTPASVVDHAGTPSIQLKPGTHRVEGSFSWDASPESLQVPSDTGLLALTLKGKPVPFPNRDESGRVWLQREATEEETENRVDLTVHRRVVDEVPLQVVTHVELQIAGKNREELLGRALLDGFIPMSLASGLPARLEPDGKLRVQLRPGHFVIELTARKAGEVTSIPLAPPDGPWAPEEVWVFDARPGLRIATVEGVPAVDPQQTTLPDAWRTLPAYRMRPTDAMRLEQKIRGDSDPAPDRLSLGRDLWLDFDGSGYTVSDSLHGTLSRSWRLEMPEPFKLGRVNVGGADQFITRLGPNAPAGVEIRQGTVRAVAESRLEGGRSVIPAVGWDQDFRDVSGVLHLPPGWRLLAASGVDEVPGTWLRSWSLWLLFLALIVALAIGRLWGAVWGAVALAAAALTFTEPDAPQMCWLFVLAAESLVRVLPDGHLRKVSRLVRLGTWVSLALFAIPFCVQQVRQGLYPAQELLGQSSASFDYERDSRRAQLETTVVPEEKSADKEEVDGLEAEDEAGIKGGVVGGSVGGKPAPASSESRHFARKRALEVPKPAKAPASPWYTREVDPSSVVQTGPGVPKWEWRRFNLKWNGPVQRAQQLHLLLAPPWLNFALALLRVALIAAMVACLTRFVSWGGRLWTTGGTALGLVLGILLVPTTSRAAEFPPQETLDQLRDRLLEPPECARHCAASARMLLDITAQGAQALMEVAAGAPTAIPLPGSAEQWVPAQVLVDGAPATALARASDGTLWLGVQPGLHRIAVSGPLPSRDSVQIPLPLKPHRVEAHVSGWTLEGLHEDGLVDEGLQLTRTHAAGSEGRSALNPGALPPFVQIERELQLGLKWETTTQVRRLTPNGSAVVLEIPLLPGESVTSADVRVERGRALVNLGPQVSELSWSSVLEPTHTLKLVAPDNASWMETWRLSVSPVLHADVTGIPPVHAASPEESRVPEWRPWPQETLTLQVRRPEGSPGQTLTVDRAVLALQPGPRATHAVLNADLRASRGMEHVVLLPEGADLQSVELNGAALPIRQEKRQVRLPLAPRSQHVQLTWIEPRGITTGFSTSSVDLGVPSTNVELRVSVPQDRWVLFLGGPRLGPAVLFWSLLVVLVLVAVGLSRTRLAPLNVRHWLLLGVGLSQVPVAAAGLVAGWLLALGYRQKKSSELGNKTFDMLQIALVCLSVGALVTLFLAVQKGLLGSPDMQIEGNGSTRGSLIWYADRSPAELPRAWVLCLPLLAYRVAMLAWALWLAFALLDWLKWGWSAFTGSGAWRRFFRPRSTQTASTT